MLDSPASFQVFVAAWEAGTLPKAEWTHAAHVAIGAAYAVRYRKDTFAQMRAGIIRYNEAVGTVNGTHSGYHETLTRLWSNVLEGLVAGMDDPYEAACVAVEKYGHRRDLHREFYNFNVAKNVEARRRWVEPSLVKPTGSRVP